MKPLSESQYKLKVESLKELASRRNLKIDCPEYKEYMRMCKSYGLDLLSEMESLLNDEKLL
jgi:hypothetical protein